MLPQDGKAKTIRKPRHGPGHQCIYPKSEDVLEECDLHTTAEYIDPRWQTIMVYMVTGLILEECRQGMRKRQAIPRSLWWEQKIDLGIMDHGCKWIRQVMAHIFFPFLHPHWFWLQVWGGTSWYTSGGPTTTP